MNHKRNKESSVSDWTPATAGASRQEVTLLDERDTRAHSGINMKNAVARTTWADSATTSAVVHLRHRGRREFWPPVAATTGTLLFTPAKSRCTRGKPCDQANKGSSAGGRTGTGSRPPLQQKKQRRNKVEKSLEL